MLIRMTILCLVLAAFAAGFSELVEHAAEVAPQRATLDCSQWNSQECNPLLFR